MAIVHSFRALRPPRPAGARVAAPPYDVVTAKEARDLAEDNPDSFLRVTRPEIDLPEGTSPSDERAHARAALNFRKLIESRNLVADPEPHLYVYAQRMGNHRQVGIVGCAAVDEYNRNIIRKHEVTREDQEQDRARHFDSLGAHDEPVFMTYRAIGEIDGIVAQVAQLKPEYDFVADDDVQHTLWVVDPETTSKLEKLFREEVDLLYVADGHHRSAAAAQVHAKRQGQPGEHDRFLAVIFPNDQMQVFPYNRLVRDPQARTPEQLIALLKEKFDVAPATSPVPEAPHSMSVYLKGQWFRVKVKAGMFDANDPSGSLDATICQDQILAPMFGITDPRRDENLGFVSGLRGPAELERRVKNDGWTLAIQLYPASVDQVMDVSDAGKLTPPKSTCFEPKPRSGLVVHLF